MKRGKSTGKPTVAEQRRIDAFRHIGCCITGSPEYDVHHLTDCGRRLGHLFTIPLSPWLHRGVKQHGCTRSMMIDMYGPSLAESKAAFEKYHGTERELLEIVNKKLEGKL